MPFEHGVSRGETSGNQKLADMFECSRQGGMRRSLPKDAGRLPDSGAFTVSKECHDQ